MQKLELKSLPDNKVLPRRSALLLFLTHKIWLRRLSVRTFLLLAGKRLAQKLNALVFREPRRRLLYVRDASSLHFLIDTEEESRLLPASLKDKHLPFLHSLEATNTQQFQWNSLIADVPQPIIGANFLEHYSLRVDLQGKALIHPSVARTHATPTLQPLGSPSASGEEGQNWSPCGDYRHLNTITTPRQILTAASALLLRATFQLFINVTHSLEGVLAYIDGILVTSASEADHALHLHTLFGRLQTVTPQGITPVQEKVTAIRKFPRRCVPKCAQLLQPLHALITPNRVSRHPNQVSDQRSLRSLQRNPGLCHPAQPPSARGSTQHSDSDAAISAVPATLGLSLPQSRYSAFGRELLPAYSAVRHIQSYVKANNFHILTDHKPLTFALHSGPAVNPLARSITSDTFGAQTMRPPMIYIEDNHTFSDPRRRRRGLPPGQQRTMPGHVHDSSHRRPDFP
ncbi:hypothetical protein C7M84_011231 [Penaeus vannamei]|uniref:Reverse transcriptase RNase H-like domain-containing protein n=1 Tax=Penaeus vannamei TaxID=6689 RepID=A0A423T235_PENVA|nr:hypothetical protein C7M84_011231 [Penaeus vannamei]